MKYDEMVIRVNFSIKSRAFCQNSLKPKESQKIKAKYSLENSMNGHAIRWMDIAYDQGK